ncbi:MAG: ATP-binding protein, partial [Candidatus Methanoperedens sp.]
MENIENELKNQDILGGLEITSTKDIEVPKKLIEQVIGQEHAVEVVRKAANQRRHVMMLGTPGTGKSMLAKAMAELLPKEELQDVLVYNNPDDPNNPKIRIVPAGKGKEITDAHKLEAQKRTQARNMFIMLLVLG